MRRHPGMKNIPFRESMRIAHGIAGSLTCKSFIRRPPDDAWLARYIKILESFVAYGEDNDYFIDQPGKVDQAVMKAMIYVHPKAEADDGKAEMQAIRRAADVLIAGGADAVLAELCRVGLYMTQPTEFPELMVAG